MVRFLSSTKLTVAICLLLALEGAAGSILYRGNTAFGEPGAFALFRSPLFLAPVALLLLNILVCAGTRLKTLSFRARRTWSFSGIHLGLLLLIAGLAVDGLYGFVGTRYYPVGVPASDYFNWRTNRDERFPFSILVADAEVFFHPRNLRIGLKGGTGKKIGLFTVREGVPFRAGDPPITVIPRTFDPETKTLLFDAEVGGKRMAGLSAGKEGSALVGGFVVVPVSFADPEPSGYRLRVRFDRPGGEAREAEIGSNRPVSFDGISFCLVDLSVDRYGNRIVGLQMTREPGAGLFWAGGILFGISLLFRFLGGWRRAAESSGETEEAAGSGEASPAGGGTTFLLIAATLCAFAGTPTLAAAGSAGRVITGEETWQGEVRVTAPVSVERGGVLRILPGTRVLLSGEDADGDGCREGYIQVFGRLLVEGKRDRPVRFARLHPDREWQEIYLQDAAGEIRYARIEGAAWGLHIHDGSVRIEQSLFRDNGGGARLKGSGASFARCTFRRNGYGLRFWDGGPKVRSSRFEGNGTALFYREGAGGGTINGNRIAGNETDLRVGDWASGDLDASRNWWGGDAENGGRIRDFRETGRPGRLTIRPVLAAPPAPCGTDIDETEDPE
ncbi:MAG: hypothetical protein Kow00128_16610 [Deltaproteobacteria bacterium]